MNYYNLWDQNFAYTLQQWGIMTATHKFMPRKVTWILRRKEFDGPAVFTDFFIKQSHIGFIRSIKSDFKVAWLIEPKSIHSWPYEEIKHMLDEFDLVLSHHQEILSLSDKCKWVPGNGSWVESGSWGVQPKHKKVCIIASAKKATHGHILRHEAIQRFADQVDVYGREYNPFPEKEDVLKDYMFSIEVENCSEENYFTEKLLDCLAVGTVPIYFGPKKGTNKYFDMEGIIPFNDADDLEDVLKTLSPELYHSKEEAIHNNLHAAKKFAMVDDYVAQVIEKHLSHHENTA